MGPYFDNFLALGLYPNIKEKWKKTKSPK